MQQLRPLDEEPDEMEPGPVRPRLRRGIVLAGAGSRQDLEETLRIPLGHVARLQQLDRVLAHRLKQKVDIALQRRKGSLPDLRRIRSRLQRQAAQIGRDQRERVCQRGGRQENAGQLLLQRRPAQALRIEAAGLGPCLPRAARVTREHPRDVARRGRHEETRGVYPFWTIAWITVSTYSGSTMTTREETWRMTWAGSGVAAISSSRAMSSAHSISATCWWRMAI